MTLYFQNLNRIGSSMRCALYSTTRLILVSIVIAGTLILLPGEAVAGDWWLKILKSGAKSSAKASATACSSPSSIPTSVGKYLPDNPDYWGPIDVMSGGFPMSPAPSASSNIRYLPIPARHPALEPSVADVLAGASPPSGSFVFQAGMGPLSGPKPLQIGPFLNRGTSFELPESVFKDGFSARGDRLDIEAHVMQRDPHLSGFISLSKEYHISRGFAKPKENPITYVYRVPKSCGVGWEDVNQIIDVSKNRFYKSKEVLAPFKVAPEVIHSVDVYLNGAYSHTLYNPNFLAQ